MISSLEFVSSFRNVYREHKYLTIQSLVLHNIARVGHGGNVQLSAFKIIMEYFRFETCISYFVNILEVEVFPERRGQIHLIDEIVVQGVKLRNFIENQEHVLFGRMDMLNRY